MPRQKAFTLIEVLIVVLILGILACLAIPQFQGAMIKAKFPEMFNLVNQYEREIDLGMLETGWGEAGGAWLTKFIIDNFPDPENNPTPHGFCVLVNYDPSPTQGYYSIDVVTRIKPTQPIYSSLCNRWVAINGRRGWTISDVHPWAECLRHVLPQESIINNPDDLFK